MFRTSPVHHLVGLHIYYKMIHGPYNVKLMLLHVSTFKMSSSGIILMYLLIFRKILREIIKKLISIAGLLAPDFKIAFLDAQRPDLLRGLPSLLLGWHLGSFPRCKAAGT